MSKQRIKQYIIWAIIGAIGYFLLSYHIIFFGKIPKLLKKTEYTLKYTFFSTHSKSPEYILEIDPLREAGIGELLVEEELLTEEERILWEEEIESEYY